MLEKVPNLFVLCGSCFPTFHWIINEAFTVTVFPIKYLKCYQYTGILPVHKEVGMCESPLQGPELHDRDESTQVVNFCLLVFFIYHSRKIEQLSTLQNHNYSAMKFSFSQGQTVADFQGIKHWAQWILYFEVPESSCDRVNVNNCSITWLNNLKHWNQILMLIWMIDTLLHDHKLKIDWSQIFKLT